MASPTSHTLKQLRQRGYLPAVVERFLQHLNIRRDLWHFGDVLAIHPGRKEFLIVQSTSLSNVPARVTKARAQPELAVWLRCGGRFEIHGWALRGGRWEAKVVQVSGEQLDAEVLTRPPRRPHGRQAQQGELF
jgi:hypothetical protein